MPDSFYPTEAEGAEVTGRKARPYDEPAFPIRGGLHDHQFVGMTLRDYFATKAPDFALDVGEWSAKECARKLGLPEGSYRWQEHYADLLAKLAYEYADAMLRARAQGAA